MAMEVDPYEAIIKLALADDGLTAVVGTRIDIWHHYGQDAGDWNLKLQSLIFVPAGGPVVPDRETRRPNIEARCYGDTPYECGQVYRKLVDFTEGHNERRVVQVAEGNALVYYILPVQEPILQFDEDIRPNGGMPYFAVQLQAEVANRTVV